MSGVEVTKEKKENQAHVCASCMGTVVEAFTHFQEQIEQLKQEKAGIQSELEKLNEEYEKKRQAMSEEIRALEKKVAELKRSSETNI